MAVMDLVLHRAYPVAFLEFVEHNGKKTREGPRNEKDELAAQDQWRVCQHRFCPNVLIPII